MRTPLQDRWALLVLTAIVVLTSSMFVPGLGVASDDWGFLAVLKEAPDQSWLGLYRTLAEAAESLAVRPPQIAWYVFFHKVSPGTTLAAHYAANVLYLLAVLVLYATLRRIPATRDAAFVIALIFCCMPNHQVIRMWYAVHQAIIAMLFFWLAAWLATFYPSPRAGWRNAILLAAMALCAAVSCLAYEMFAFFTPLLPAFIWLGRGLPVRSLLGSRAFVAATAALTVPIVMASLFKISYEYAFAVPGEGISLTGFMTKAVMMYLRVGFASFWLDGPWTARTVLGLVSGPFFDWRALVAAVAVAALLAFLFKSRISWRTIVAGLSSGYLLTLIVIGSAVFALSYVPLLANFYYSGNPFGDGSRVHAGSAIGVAIVFFACFAWVEQRVRGLGMMLLLAYCAAGIFIQVSIGRMWVGSKIEQDRRFELVRAATRSVPHDFVVLIHGACPYNGAAPVFYSTADLLGRMRVDPGVAQRVGDTIDIRSRLAADGIVTRDYGEDTVYPFGRMLLVDMRDGSSRRIASYEDAKAFFIEHPITEATNCAYNDGEGTRIFGI